MSTKLTTNMSNNMLTCVKGGHTIEVDQIWGMHALGKFTNICPFAWFKLGTPVMF